MTAPRRIQLSRVKGWRMPPNTVKVDRSTKWGNPFNFLAPDYCWLALSYGCLGNPAGRHEASVRAFREWVTPIEGKNLIYMERSIRFGSETKNLKIGPTIKVGPPPTLMAIQTALRGKNLACWCKIGQPCHADVLLEIANRMKERD